jgi:hypothetical protein
MKKAYMVIEGQALYFDMKFTGDSITPVYKFTMFIKRKPTLFNWKSYMVLISRTYHESNFESFTDACHQLHRAFVVLQRKLAS